MNSGKLSTQTRIIKIVVRPNKVDNAIDRRFEQRGRFMEGFVLVSVDIFFLLVLKSVFPDSCVPYSVVFYCATLGICLTT